MAEYLTEHVFVAFSFMYIKLKVQCSNFLWIAKSSFIYNIENKMFNNNVKNLCLVIILYTEYGSI